MYFLICFNVQILVARHLKNDHYAVSVPPPALDGLHAARYVHVRNGCTGFIGFSTNV